MRLRTSSDSAFVGTLPLVLIPLLTSPVRAAEPRPVGSLLAPFLQPRPAPALEPKPAQGTGNPPATVDETVVTAEQPVVEPTPIDRIGSREVLTQEDIDRIAPRSMNDLVQWLPGVSSRPYNGAEFSAPNFAIRGLPDDGLTEYILTTIDGVPANPMPYGWTALSYFPLLPDQVAGVELLKGGFAVRNGPNTVGGVLNFLTPPIPTESLTTVRSSYGSHDFFSTLASHGDTVGDFGYLVTAGFLGGDGYRDAGEFEAQSIDAKLRWDLGGGDYLATHAGFFSQRHQRPGGLTLADYDVDPYQNVRPENHHEGDRWVADMTLHRDDGGDDFTEYYGWLSSTSNAIIGTTPFFGATTFRANTYTQYYAALGLRQERGFDWIGLDHHVHWGVRALQEYLPSRRFLDRPVAGGPETITTDVQSDYTTFSAHVDDTIRPTKALSITAGLRAEYVPIAHSKNKLTGDEFDDDFFDVLPAAGLSYQFTDDFAAFASYQQSFRAPQVWGFGVSPAAVDDGQDLDFEGGEGMEAGLRWRAVDGLEVTATVWRTVFDEVAFTVDSVYQNIGKVEANGVDFGATWDLKHTARALSGFRVGAAVTFQDSELADAADPAFDGNQTPFAWEEKLNWFLEYETRDNWVVGLDGYYIGESYADEANTVEPNANGTIGLNPSRTIWGAGISKVFALAKGGKMRLAFDVTNILDQEWFLYSRSGGKLVGAPLMGFVTLDLAF